MAIEVRLGEKEILATALDFVGAKIEALSLKDLASHRIMTLQKELLRRKAGSDETMLAVALILGFYRIKKCYSILMVNLRPKCYSGTPST